MESTSTYSEIDAVIAYIQEHIHEPISLHQLAKYAAYSPYHFSRVFKQQTGLSPYYYVASLKLQHAKNLLLNTNLPVRDVGMEIGQQSLGTFTTRFTEKIGMTPAQFRNSPNHVNTYLQFLKNEIHSIEAPSLIEKQNRVEIQLEIDKSFRGVILVGLFPKPIAEGLPLYGTIKTMPGNVVFSDVKPGVYYVMSTALSWEMNEADILLPYKTLRAKADQPVMMDEKDTVIKRKLIYRPPRFNEPPILISLPLLMKVFLSKQ